MLRVSPQRGCILTQIQMIGLILKGLFVRECAEGSQCSRKTLCVCVCGEMYLLLVRGVSRSKTLIPLILVTTRLDAFYYNNK